MVAILPESRGPLEIDINAAGITGGGGGITTFRVDTRSGTPWLGNDGYSVLFMILAAVFIAVAGPFISAVAVAYGQQWSRVNVTEGYCVILGTLIIVATATARHFSLLDNVRRCRL